MKDRRVEVRYSDLSERNSRSLREGVINLLVGLL